MLKIIENRLIIDIIKNYEIEINENEIKI
jgi:hypothetical protein